MPPFDRRPELPALTLNSRTLQLVHARPSAGPLLVSEEPHVDGPDVRKGGPGFVVGDVRALEAEGRFGVHEMGHGEAEAGEIEIVAVPGPAVDRDQALGLE